jgi:hypothetical protein
MRIEWALLGLVLCGCASGAPEPASPGEQPEVAAGAGAPAPETAPDPAAVVASLTAEPPAAYYLPEDGTALVASVINVEGTSTTVTVNKLKPGGEKETIAEWELANDEGESAKVAEAARRALAERLTGVVLVPLTFTKWPEDKDALELASPKLTLGWRKQGAAVEARIGGKVVTVAEVMETEPQVPSPIAVYASADSPVVVVQIEQDPGEHYTEGFNYFTEMLRLDLPK